MDSVDTVCCIVFDRFKAIFCLGLVGSVILAECCLIGCHTPEGVGVHDDVKWLFESTGVNCVCYAFVNGLQVEALATELRHATRPQRFGCCVNAEQRASVCEDRVCAGHTLVVFPVGVCEPVRSEARSHNGNKVHIDDAKACIPADQITSANNCVISVDLMDTNTLLGDPVTSCKLARCKQDSALCSRRERSCHGTNASCEGDSSAIFLCERYSSRTGIGSATVHGASWSVGNVSKLFGRLSVQLAYCHQLVV